MHLQEKSRLLAASLSRLPLRADIALTRDEASRFLPWIIALMVYLAALVLAGSFTLSHTIMASHRAQMDGFSVHLPHMNEKEKEHGTVDKALAIVRNMPGVEDADILTSKRIEEMVEPWLGKSESLSSLPLPTVIEAKVAEGSTVDYEDLKTRISAVAPAASIDDHKKWMAQFSAFVNIVQLALFCIALLIICTTASIVIFACKTSLKIHRGTVNLLHRMGAVDSYIAAQFQHHAAALTLKGAFIGSGFAGATLLALHFMAHNLDSPLFPSFTFSFFHWMILFTLPLLMGLLAFAAARFSVLATLRRMP
jgi:cell division transport system permease protein